MLWLLIRSNMVVSEISSSQSQSRVPRRRVFFPRQTYVILHCIVPASYYIRINNDIIELYMVWVWRSIIGKFLMTNDINLYMVGVMLNYWKVPTVVTFWDQHPISNITILSVPCYRPLTVVEESRALLRLFFRSSACVINISVVLSTTTAIEQ